MSPILPFYLYFLFYFVTLTYFFFSCLRTSCTIFCTKFYLLHHCFCAPKNLLNTVYLPAIIMFLSVCLYLFWFIFLQIHCTISIYLLSMLSKMHRMLFSSHNPEKRCDFLSSKDKKSFFEAYFEMSHLGNPK